VLRPIDLRCGPALRTITPPMAAISAVSPRSPARWPEAIAEALRACWVFSIVNRTVDAMGGRHPSAELQARASKVLYALGMPWLRRFRRAPANGSPARARPVPPSMRQDVFTLRAAAALVHVTSTDGVTSPALRAEVSRYVLGHCGLGAPVTLSDPRLERYLRKVTLHAYKVTDDDIAALVAAGLSEDAVWELTVVVGIASAAHRYVHAMAQLDRCVSAASVAA
jgi:alkylhydroperoxidase family enzyme